MSRKILVTAALPYANGPIHLGHMLEFIQTDIWVRFQRSQGHECYFAWADDAHGTPIMLRAKREGIEPEVLIQRFNEEHQRDFRAFRLSYDHFGSTHSETNRQLVTDLYQKLNQAGHIERRTIEQLFDEDAGLFLPDRFIRGTCPHCRTEDQYGDACESCGKTYAATDLIDPHSALTGSQPVLKPTEHLFFRLSEFSDELQQWIHSGTLQPEVANKLEEWFEDGLRDWDISRDAPYFGFEIPDAPGKYFYVWVDAPVGYMASFKALCEQHDLVFEDWWGSGSDAEVHHFIGKDIIYFHTLFWPAMLNAAGYRRPTAVHAHGFLTVDGAKMSKSRGTFINAATYLDHLDPDYLRYYFAAKLGSGLADIDLNLEDFVLRVNADLVGKLVNIASRCARFIEKHYDNRLADSLHDDDLYGHFLDAQDTIAGHFEQRSFQTAIRECMTLADRANQYIDEHKPWQLIKQADTEKEVHQICTQGLNLFRALMTWLAPVVPGLAQRAEEFLDTPIQLWSDLQQPLLDHQINSFTTLLTRIDDRDVNAMIEASKEDLKPAEKIPDASAEGPGDLAPEIDYDAFMQVDLRVAEIVRAEQVEGADKLLQLTVDLGGSQRNILAGIRKAYDPADLEGRLTVVVANLKPRKMRFGVSEGMVLATGPGGDELYILSPDSGARPGQRVT